MAQENHGTTAVDSRLAQAKGLLSTGAIDRAVDLLRGVLQADSANPEALHMLGAVTHHTGDLPAAARLLEQAVTLAPDEFDYRITYGNLLCDRRELAQAISQFSRATELNADHVLGWYNLGNTLQSDGQVQDAVAAFRRAVAADPGHVDARNNLGAALQDLGEREEAVRCFEDLLKEHPKHSPALFNLHTVLFDDRDLGPAQDALERLLRHEPGHGLAYFHLALILAIQGDARSGDMFKHLSRSPGWLPLLESWDYLRSVRSKRTRFFGTKFELLAFALKKARSRGLVCEFGVRRGTSIRWIAGQVKGPVHGFDSFEGLPDRWGDNPEGIYTTRGALPQVPDNVKLHPGLFGKTLPGFLSEHDAKLRFANIDCDIYGSTRKVFENVADRIRPGTVLVFDEYLFNPTWREDEHKAFLEAAQANGWQYEYIAFGPVSKQAAIRIL